MKYQYALEVYYYFELLSANLIVFAFSYKYFHLIYQDYGTKFN